MKQIIKYLSVAVSLFILEDKAAAQNFPAPQFTHITTTNGLSSNLTNCTAEDSLGFMWIGTNNGLNRYDGYRCKQYYHNDSDSTSLVNNTILGLYCDKKGRLWLSTANGVSCFLPWKNSFVNYSSGQLGDGSGNFIYEDAQGHIWISPKRNYLFRVLPDMSLQKIALPSMPGYPAVYNKQGYTGIFRDHKGNEWAYTNQYLFLLDVHTKQPSHVYDLAKETGNGYINVIKEDSRGNLWIVSWTRGILRFDPATGTATGVPSLPEDTFADLAEWKYGNHTWLVALKAFSGAAYLLNPASLQAQKMSNSLYVPHSLRGNTFTSLRVDRNGGLWICTDHGINYARVNNRFFEVLPLTEPGSVNYEEQTNHPVFSYFEDGEDTWLSKRGTNTFIVDTAMAVKKVYASLWPLSESRQNWKMTAFYFWKKGDELYITTDSGLVVYNRARESTSLYVPPGKDIYPDLRTIIPLPNNEIMIRSYSSGAFIFDTGKKLFLKHINITDSCFDCLPQRINYLFKSSANKIYCTASKMPSLLVYNPAAGRFAPVELQGDNAETIQATSLLGMDEDEKGHLWVASSAGIFVIDPDKKLVLAHHSSNGKMGSAFRICFDNYQNAWCTASSGIWCYIRNKNKWIQFTATDGMSGDDYQNMILKRKNGDIIAGLEGAVAVFHPDKLVISSPGSPVIITEAVVNEKEYSFFASPASAKKITLQPGQHFFSVDFSLLDYASVSSSQYFYLLEPIMKNYRANENGHINFNGLSPGHYVLHVRGGDKAGNIYPEEDLISITVQPYWYQTRAFKFSCLLAASLLVFALVRRRIKYIRNQANLKQKIAETEMQALRAQMNPHFIFNSLNSIENFIMKNDKLQASEYLNKFARLVRMILDSSRNELVPVPKDMEALQLYVDLEQLRYKNKFTYKTNIDPELLTGGYRVPSLIIQPYVENAIVHGLAHSQSEGLCLMVSAQLENETIKFTVEDNGVGRSKAREYNQLNKPNHKSFGMKITEDRVNLFNRQPLTGNNIQFTDILDENGNAAGTKVEVIIKAH